MESLAVSFICHVFRLFGFSLFNQVVVMGMVKRRLIF